MINETRAKNATFCSTFWALSDGRHGERGRRVALLELAGFPERPAGLGHARQFGKLLGQRVFGFLGRCGRRRRHLCEDRMMGSARKWRLLG